MEYAPLRPARGEGEHTEIKKIPSPLMGEGEGGGDLWDFFTPSEGLQAVISIPGSLASNLQLLRSP